MSVFTFQCLFCVPFLLGFLWLLIIFFEFQVGDGSISDRSVFVCGWQRYIDSMCGTVEDVWVWSLWRGHSSPRHSARDGPALSPSVPRSPHLSSGVQRPPAVPRAHRSDISSSPLAHLHENLYLREFLHCVFTPGKVMETLNIHFVHNTFLGLRLVFFKILLNVSYADQGCIYMIKNTIKTEIFWNIIVI